jgi:CcmD family protein
MNANHYLYAAYIMTWVIHGTYLYNLTRKAKRVRKEIEKLKKPAIAPSAPQQKS